MRIRATGSGSADVHLTGDFYANSTDSGKTGKRLSTVEYVDTALADVDDDIEELRGMLDNASVDITPITLGDDYIQFPMREQPLSSDGVNYKGLVNNTSGLIDFIYDVLSTIVDHDKVDVSSGCASKFRNDETLIITPLMNTSMCTSFLRMFQDCVNLETVLPMDVSQGTNFSYMFRECSSLTSVSLVSDKVPTYGVGMFSGSGITPTTGTIYVPDELVDDWRTANGWSNYADVIKPVSEKPE